MANATEELQQLADRGELERTTRRALTEQHQQQIAVLIDKRWIVMQVVELTKAHPTTPDDFRALCEFIRDFIS